VIYADLALPPDEAAANGNGGNSPEYALLNFGRRGQVAPGRPGGMGQEIDV